MWDRWHHSCVICSHCFYFSLKHITSSKCLLCKELAASVRSIQRHLHDMHPGHSTASTNHCLHCRFIANHMPTVKMASQSVYCSSTFSGCEHLIPIKFWGWCPYRPGQKLAKSLYWASTTSIWHGNSCVAFANIFSELTECPLFSEPCYLNGNESAPRCQFVTLPLGLQLQALWHRQVTVMKLRDWLRRTAKALAQESSEDGILDYDEICCGSEYLNLVKTGQISDHDMYFIFEQFYMPLRLN